MKVLKFGGTSVGTVARIKHVARLICSEEPKLVILSAMSGTTNALVEITERLSEKDIKGATESIKNLEKKYLSIPEQLYYYGGSTGKARKYITDSFLLLKRITKEPFSDTKEKIILAQGELIVTRLMHLYLAETGINSALLPATEFMKTNKYGEPDMRFIKKNLQKIMKNTIKKI